MLRPDKPIAIPALVGLVWIILLPFVGATLLARNGLVGMLFAAGGTFAYFGVAQAIAVVVVGGRVMRWLFRAVFRADAAEAPLHDERRDMVLLGTGLAVVLMPAAALVGALVQQVRHGSWWPIPAWAALAFTTWALPFLLAGAGVLAPESLRIMTDVEE